jgi:hypothetical protein
MNKNKTQCPQGHLYEGDNLVIYKRGDKEIRVCRVCKNTKANAYYHEKIKPVKHPGRPGRPKKTIDLALVIDPSEIIDIVAEGQIPNVNFLVPVENTEKPLDK